MVRPTLLTSIAALAALAIVAGSAVFLIRTYPVLPDVLPVPYIVEQFVGAGVEAVEHMARPLGVLDVVLAVERLDAVAEHAITAVLIVDARGRWCRDRGSGCCRR